MQILVIKQTSLGDVLHSTGHIRTIKQNFPHSRLVLLTADSSADIYRHNPWVDEIIRFESYRVKREWNRRPLHTIRYLAKVIAQVRTQHFDLAFDLQGLGKSVLFLYTARAAKKYVKGNWLGLMGFRNPSLHAIAEMDGVLRRAQLSVHDTSMEFFTASAERKYVDGLLAQINPHNKPLLVFSPFSRWNSKDWPLQNYIEIAKGLGGEFSVVFTAVAGARQLIDDALPPTGATDIHNLAGQLGLSQFAELVSRAKLLLGSDSFPMHVACAQKTPVIALFGPTDESKTGPNGALHRVIRVPDCQRCHRALCRRHCLAKLPIATVLHAVHERLKTSGPKSD